MKRIYLLTLCSVSVFVGSFTTVDNAARNTFNFFYVDNSHSRGYESFTQDMFDLVELKVDSLKEDKNSSIGFFLSNGQNPVYASNYKGAKNIVSKLANGYTNNPGSFFDKRIILDNILNTDLSGVNRVNLHFFVSESYLLNDLLSSNAGILLNTLPKEIQYLLGCEEEKMNIIIYYPASSKKIKIQDLQSFCNFTDIHKDFSSKIKFRFQPI